MAKKKIISPANSFKGFDWKKFLSGRRRGFVALISAVLLIAQDSSPGFKAFILGSGLTAESIYGLIEFYLMEK